MRIPERGPFKSHMLSPKMVRRMILHAIDANSAIDSMLKSLQCLAAHLKLLLDAPEHLWRLLEHKRYLRATWLFLLSRVVHRSLLRKDNEDEDRWERYGVDVQVCGHYALRNGF